ncbi:hypothetical protein F4560_004188 [Saccharothrix ecbatanensis]|uniref:DUF397 domain-containing protein n=1 Tax=Saccharothrix ecbatanensis TaxID=1105145 RepID=A0A7W9HLH6_9PSEU|nr:DUF397 domain-containing protein [Saccharothrix ecbatanensis]MBB5804420.1 hypothetical protein [Saccharothrix ecbatanensis]
MCADQFRHCSADPLPDGGVAMRNSTLGDAGPVIRYTKAELRAFILGAQAGEVDDLI